MPISLAPADSTSSNFPNSEDIPDGDLFSAAQSDMTVECNQLNNNCDFYFDGTTESFLPSVSDKEAVEGSCSLDQRLIDRYDPER